MPRPRSPNRDKAFELWLESGKNRTIKDISEELGVSENQVRKWKNQDDWENREALPNVTKPNGNTIQTNGNVTNQTKPVKRRCGAPKGNKNRYEHGLYANPTMDMIPRQELERLQRMDFEDEESIIIDEIILLTSRERQLLESIQRYQDQKNGLSLDGVTRRVVENEGARDSRSKQVETTTRTRDVFDVIQKLQAELTKVQKEKRQYLSELRILRAQKAQMPKEENTHERVLQEISSEELRQFMEGERQR